MKAAARAQLREPDAVTSIGRTPERSGRHEANRRTPEGSGRHETIGRTPEGSGRHETIGRTPEGSGRHESIGVSLWVRLLASHNLLLAQVRRRLATECTLPRFDLLANLEREDGQTLAALSRRMLVTAGNLTGLVDRAERDGVVERRTDPSDKRLSRIFLTGKGRELVRGLIPKHAHYVNELLSALDPGDRRELRRLLGKLRESLAPRREAP